jgi:hypothetical protein
MKKIKNISLLLARTSRFMVPVFILFFLSACTHPARIVSIIGSSKYLFVVTHDWSIKVYDPSTRKLLDSIEIPEKIHDVNGFGEILSVLEERGNLFIQASAVSFRPNAQSIILNNASILKANLWQI